MGRFKKAGPLMADVHVNRPMTNMSVAFFQDPENFVAGKVYPTLPSVKQSDLYFDYDRGYFARDEMKARAYATESAGSHYDIDSDNLYYCKKFSHHFDIPEELEENSDTPINLDREATKINIEKALIRKEKLFAANHFVTGKWGTSQTTSNWGSSGTATDPNEDFETARSSILLKTGKMPNTLVFGRQTYGVLKHNADVIDLISGGSTTGDPALATIDAMKRLWEVENIYVMNASENTAKEGAANSFAFIGGAHALMCYVEKNPGPLTASAGYTFAWTGKSGVNSEGVRIKDMELPLRDARRNEIDMYVDLKLIAADLGYFFDTPITSA